MSVKTVLEAIPTVGFPIVCCIALAVFIFIIYKNTNDREKTLLNEIKENRKINAEAIATISKYAEKLEVIQTDISEIKTDITVIMAKQ